MTRKWRENSIRLIAGTGFTAVAVVVYALVLQYTYKRNISPYYSYQGLTYREPDWFYYATAIVATVVVAVVLPSRIRKVSDFLLWLLFVLGAAPSILLAQYSQTLTASEATIMGLCVAGCMVVARIGVESVHLTRSPVRRLNRGVDFWVLLGTAAVVIYVYMIAAYGIAIRPLSLTDVYDVREDFGAATSSAPMLGYMLPVLTKVINPLLMARGVFSLRFVPFGLGAFGQMAIYSSTGQKNVLFYIAVAIGLGLLFRFGLRPPGRRILFVIGGAASLGFVLDWVTGSRLWSSLLVRRVMVVPGALTAAYVAVFDGMPRMNFAEVLPFVEDPYTGISPVYIVGAAFVGSPETAANVNIFGHGYLNFGYIGMFVETGVLVALLLLANLATRGLPTPVACIAFFAPGMAFASASVFTAMLTHGFLAAVVICALAPGNGWGKRTSVLAAESSSNAMNQFRRVRTSRVRT